MIASTIGTLGVTRIGFIIAKAEGGDVHPTEFVTVN